MLKHQDRYFIDVNCQQSAAGITLLIELSDEEYSEYHALGRDFLRYFAAKINYWSKEYLARNARAEVQELASQAIQSWQKARSSA